jgi:secreted PhoX family phosphatase
MPKNDMPIEMVLRWIRRSTALSAVLLTTLIYAGPCQSQAYTAAAQKTKSQGLWVINFNFLDEFQGESLKKSGAPRETFGLTSADGSSSIPNLTFDRAGNLWVIFGTGVGELTRNELSTSKRLFRFHVQLSFVATGAADPYIFPSTLAFDPAGDLWLAGTAPKSTLIEFTPDQLATSGNSTPASTINFPGDSGIGSHSILFDSAGDLWLASQFSVSDSSVAVVEYTPAQIAEMQMGASPTPTLTVKAGPEFSGLSAIAFDKTGNLWIAVPTPESGANLVYGGLLERFNVAGKTGTLSQPDVVISPANISSTNQSMDRPNGIAFDGQGGLWVSSDISSGRNDTGFVVKFAADQLTVSGSPVPPIVLTPNRKASNLDYPAPIVFGSTVK